jgi:hypothetical protein
VVANGVGGHVTEQIVEAVALWAHPAHPSVAVDSLTASARRSGTSLFLRYELRGRLGDIVIAPPEQPIRTDRLWETTCFEAFLQPADGTDYVELNFAPSGRWAAYAFEAYRSGMVQASLPAPPEIAVTVEPGLLVLEAAVSLNILRGPCRLGLCAVIEHESRRKSYWALAHAGEKPDFHDPHCFQIELPTASLNPSPRA